MSKKRHRGSDLLCEVEPPFPAVTRMLTMLSAYEHWSQPNLSPHWARWVQNADRQELMTVTAAALLRLAKEG